MRRPALTCATTVALIVGSTVVVGSAQAAPDRQVSISVHLASDAHAVARLARTRGLSHGQRLRQMHAAVAPRTAARTVTSYLTNRGFHILGSSPFVVQAEATEQIVDATFSRASGQLNVPAALEDDATFAVSSDQQTGIFKPLALDSALTGGDIRTLYGAPTGAPPAGHKSPVVATLQFSGWNSNDLTTFALNNGLADPVASGRYTEVSVDGADPALPDGYGGEVEVALDQETLLMTAPHARQVAYFAPNNAMGVLDAIEQVATDAYFGDNIGALSISYGNCEADLPAAFLSALHQVITDAVSAGVTVFAASGDSGAYECAPGDVTVSSPASDPLVVAVGGTSIASMTPTPVETVWWDGTSGSGGGTSTAYDEPAYQQASAPGLPGRGLPDISLDGDPETGIVIDVNGLSGAVGGTSLASPLAAGTFVDLLSSSGSDYGIGDIHRNLYAAPATAFRDVTQGGNGAYVAGPGYDLASGLGAPQWSELRDALVGFPRLHAPTKSRSRTIPVSVTAPAGMSYAGWRIGTTNEPSDCGTPTSSRMPTSVTTKSDGAVQIYLIGYTSDGYCYVDHDTTRVDSVAPTTLSEAHATNRHSIRFSWAASDHSPSSGVTGYRVKVFKAGKSAALFARSHTSRQTYTFRHAKPGTTYVVRVTAVDGVGNKSKVSTARVTLH